MPKKTETPTQENTTFSKTEWLSKVKEKVMSQPWGTAVMKASDSLMLEIVRVGESDNLMLRIRTPNVRNSIKLTRKEHIESLLELVNAIAENQNNLKDKLEALMETLPRGGRRVAEEEI